jgi:hypothetical protein
MKRTFFIGIFLFISVLGYSQTWTTQAESLDLVFTVITSDQFQRIMQANQTINKAVKLAYFDYLEFINGLRLARTIGSIPNFNGYFYLNVRAIPKNDYMKYWEQRTAAYVFYGNTRTNAVMTVTFYTENNLTDVLSLKTQYNEYIKQYNQLLNIVNGN